MNTPSCWSAESFRANDQALGAPQRALDLGCGLGSELAHLTQRGVALTVGVDRSMAALQRGRRLHPAVEFVRSDVLALPFAHAGVARLPVRPSRLPIADPQGVGCFGRLDIGVVMQAIIVGMGRQGGPALAGLGAAGPGRRKERRGGRCRSAVAR